ncbi:hypothetical protein [Beijerinckia indica]|uniref:Uncharacterized protein n=1 Tax=Beijerinckia indica subsp. indica (strain ATCC 9039 / DSM 1715 / NCIMB 8712) TaxID=395963 RepID=B2ILJ4_BEII9|nr:hypothetical protein [Beijerinckia indica]ACB97394.1 hypothetical protein Bind_3865 [Beijerinckia indica subsp. indica ATCC 9039]
MTAQTMALIEDDDDDDHGSSVAQSEGSHALVAGRSASFWRKPLPQWLSGKKARREGSGQADTQAELQAPETAPETEADAPIGLPGEGQAILEPPQGAEGAQTPGKSQWKPSKPLLIGVSLTALLVAANIGIMSYPQSSPSLPVAGPVAERQAGPLAPLAKLATVQPHQPAEDPTAVSVPAQSPMDELLSFHPVDPITGKASGGEEHKAAQPILAKLEVAPQQSKTTAFPMDYFGTQAFASLNGQDQTSSKPAETVTEPMMQAATQAKIEETKSSDIPRVDVKEAKPSSQGTVPQTLVTSAVSTDPHDAENRALAMVTEYATIVGELRTEVAEMKQKLAHASQSNEARISDLERRVTFTEARRALDAAHDAPRLVAMPVPPGAQKAGGKPSANTGMIKASFDPSSREPTPSIEGRPRYRVQAASPNLAMLTALDRSGEADGQIQVAIGDVIPNYGRVKQIAQKGTSWVIETDQGTIE